MTLSSAQLSTLIKGGESDTVEFKSIWYDLKHAEGKATLAKDVLALSNTVRPDGSAYLIFGVEDERRGSGIVGVVDPPDAETVSNILSQYVHPPAIANCRNYNLGKQLVSVLTVSWAPARPHHSLRDHPGILSSNAVYVRRDKTIGLATLPEIEAMIRDKDSRMGPVISQEPIKCGFVGRGELSSSGAITARVTNVTTEPIGGIDVSFDVRHARNPELFDRLRRLLNAVIGPGESREVELRSSDVRFYLASFDETGKQQWRSVSLGGHVGDYWFDVTLQVSYRDRDGFIRTIERQIAVTE